MNGWFKPSVCGDRAQLEEVERNSIEGTAITVSLMAFFLLLALVATAASSFAASLSPLLIAITGTFNPFSIFFWVFDTCIFSSALQIGNLHVKMGLLVLLSFIMGL